MSQIATSDPADAAAAPHSFIVAQNARGQWVARERRGFVEGVFLTQRDAIRFALLRTASGRAGVANDDAGAGTPH